MKRIVKYITQPQVTKSIYLLLCMIIVSSTVIHAQTEPGDPNNAAPIDGGLSLLIAAGIGYGVKKIKEKKQQKDTNVLDK